MPGPERYTILELLIWLYCGKLADAVRQGMPRQYTDQEDDLPTLRGRLDVTRQFSTLAVSPQKLACRFDARSPDIALNQVMRAAISKSSIRESYASSCYGGGEAGPVVGAGGEADEVEPAQVVVQIAGWRCRGGGAGSPSTYCGGCSPSAHADRPEPVAPSSG